MSESMRVRLRQLLLVSSGLTFGVIALLTLATPRQVAEQYGYTLESVNSHNEFRAVFFGMWLGLMVIMLTAARRIDLPILGNLVGLFLILQAAGRVLSLLIDGVPGPTFLGAGVLELSNGILILVLRPPDPRPPAS